MPAYQFRCTKCDDSFELSLSIKEKEEGKAICPSCNSKEVKQIIGASGILKHGLSKSCDPSPACGGCSSGGCPVR